MPKTNACIGALISATKWMPVLVTCSIFSWGWYAYTIQLTLISVTSLPQQIVYIVIFNCLYILSFWSYLRTIFTTNAKIPSRFYLSLEISEDLVRAQNEQHRDEILSFVVKKNDLPVACRTYSGGIRFCEKCNLIKPDRCHHCSICGSCVPRMDHHCPWINNCVSFSNYKFFVLFLGYTFFLCLYVAATAFPYFLKFWSMPELTPKPSNTDNPQDVPTASNATAPFSTKFHILFLFFVSSMLSLGVMFLFFYHIHLLLSNRSTLESFRPALMTYGPDKNAFNLGKSENFLQLFGRSKLFWFLPVYTTEGSGITYQLRAHMGVGDEEARQELLNTNNTPTRNNIQPLDRDLMGKKTSNKDTSV